MKKTLFLTAILAAVAASQALAGSWNESNTVYTFTGTDDLTLSQVNSETGVTGIVIEKGATVSYSGDITLANTITSVQVDGTLSTTGKLTLSNSAVNVTGDGTVSVGGQLVFFNNSDAKTMDINVANLSVSGVAKTDAFNLATVLHGNVSLQSGYSMNFWGKPSTLEFEDATVTLGAAVSRGSGTCNTTPVIYLDGSNTFDVTALTPSETSTVTLAPVDSSANGFGYQGKEYNVFADCTVSYVDADASATFKANGTVLDGRLDTASGKFVYDIAKVGTYVVQTGTVTTATMAAAAEEESLTLNAAIVYSGNTVQITDGSLNLKDISGAGNVEVLTATSLSSGNNSAATGNLTVKDAVLTLSSDKTTESNLASFATVTLNNGELKTNAKMGTMHNLTIIGKSKINYQDYTDDLAATTLADTTTIAEGNTLEIYSNWKSTTTIDKLVGAGTLNMTAGGSPDSTRRLTVKNINDFTGTITTGVTSGTWGTQTTQAYVTLAAAFDAVLSATLTNGDGVIEVTTASDATFTGTQSINALHLGGTLTNSGTLTVGTTSGTATLDHTIINKGTLTLNGTVNFDLSDSALSNYVISACKSSDDTFTGNGTTTIVSTYNLLSSDNAITGTVGSNTEGRSVTQNGNTYTYTSTTGTDGYLIQETNSAISKITGSPTLIAVATTGELVIDQATTSATLASLVGDGKLTIGTTGITIGNTEDSPAVTKMSGTLAVTSGGVLLIGGTANGDNARDLASVDSFSAVELSGGNIAVHQAHTTLNDVTAKGSTTQGETLTSIIKYHDSDAWADATSEVKLAGLTTVESGAKLILMNQWKSRVEVASLTGKGTLEINGCSNTSPNSPTNFTLSGACKSEAGRPYEYIIDSFDDFAGQLVLNNSSAQVTLNLAEGESLSSTQITKTAAAKAEMTGSGTYTIGAENTQAVPVVTFSSTAWTGTAVLNNVGIKGNLASCGVSGSTIDLTSVNGWALSGTVAADVNLNDGTAYQIIDGGSSAVLTFSGKVKGAGNIAFNSTLPSGMASDGGLRSASGYGIKFTGDVSEWTGSVLAQHANINLTLEFGQTSDTTIAASVSSEENNKLALSTSGAGVKTFNGTINTNTITTGGGKTVFTNAVTTTGLVKASAGTNLVFGSTTSSGDWVSSVKALALNSLKIESGAEVMLNYTKGSLGNVEMAGGTLFYRDSKNQSNDGITIDTLTVSAASSLTKDWKGNLGVTTLTGSGNLAISNSATEGGTDQINLTIDKVQDYTGTMSSTADKFNTTIKAAEQTGTNSGTFSQNVTLADGFTKTGTGTLNLTGTTSFAGKVTVNAGSLNLAKTAVTISELTMGGGTLTLGDASTAEGHNVALTTSTLTVNADSNLNANLVVKNGSISFADVEGAENKVAKLTMGCSIDLTGTTITLSADTYEYITSAMEAQTYGTDAAPFITLFDDVESATLTGTTLSFTDVTNADPNIKLAYDAANKSVYVTPEPATATLSLLALAGLCARRRRH